MFSMAMSTAPAGKINDKFGISAIYSHLASCLSDSKSKVHNIKCKCFKLKFATFAKTLQKLQKASEASQPSWQIFTLLSILLLLFFLFKHQSKVMMVFIKDSKLWPHA